MGKKEKQENGKKAPKSYLKEVCSLLGLEMHQKFNIISGRDGSRMYEEAGPFFFAETGIYGQDGKQYMDRLLPELMTGAYAAEPLPGYAHTEDAEKLRGKVTAVEIASYRTAGGDKKLSTVITADGRDVSWRVEQCAWHREPQSGDFTDFAQAVEAYNRIGAYM